MTNVTKQSTKKIFECKKDEVREKFKVLYNDTKGYTDHVATCG
jgi:glutaredoxin 2